MICFGDNIPWEREIFLQYNRQQYNSSNNDDIVNTILDDIVEVCLPISPQRKLCVHLSLKTTLYQTMANGPLISFATAKNNEL